MVTKMAPLSEFGRWKSYSTVFVCLTLSALLTRVQTQISSVVLDKQTGQLKVTSELDPDFIAWANFTDQIKQTGWAYLEVTTSGKYNDSLQAYAAGLVTSFSLYRDYQLLAVSGPTWDQVPPFQWSRSPYSRLLHMGHPDTWAFPVTSGSRVSREHQLNARPLFPRVHEYYEAGLEFREVGVNPCTRAA
ncbi:UNVERIFIED_CONTAM: hypothetical protein FKN15_039231 [Acipenser sinensis]